jgi:hypothetical protein
METDGAGGVPAANWYPDPFGRHEFRYWDGATWTVNVSDGGQQSVDPMEAPPAQPATTVPLAVAAGTRPAARGSKKLLIIGAVVLVIAGLVAWGYPVITGSLAAKDAAASSIADARTAIASADSAVEPGSPELTESQKSKSELDEAASLVAQGSLIDAGPYRSAKTKADDARVIAEGITQRVATAAAAAAAASPDDAVDLYFALATQYPRTQQGQDAVGNAATALLGNLTGTDLDNLDAIKDFCDKSPGTVPQTVYDAAATSIRSIANASLDQQASAVSSNKSWVKKIRGKGVNFTISSTTSQDTDEMNHILDVLSVVHATDFHAAVTLLRDSSKLGQSCGKIAKSPVRRKGRVEYFSRSQISRIAKYSSQMAGKISKARGLLQDL